MRHVRGGTGFVSFYNHAHHHTGIGLHTPADVHYGLAAARAAARTEVLAAARAANPDRFTTRHDPKILALPEAVWINRPENEEREQTPAA